MTKRLRRGRLCLSGSLIAAALNIPLTVRAQELQVWWSPKLHLSSLNEISQALAARVSMRGLLRYPLLRKGGSLQRAGGSWKWVGGSVKRVDNCDDYLGAVTAGFHTVTNLDAAMERPFAERCYVLRYLEHVQPARTSFFPAGALTPAVTGILPPIAMGLEPELEQKAEEAGRKGISWKAYDTSLKITAIQLGVLYAEDNTTSYAFEVFARGDFDHDGVEDWAVLLSGHARGGSFGFSYPAVITRLGPHRVAKFLTSQRPPFGLMGVASGRQ
jgi:hypothetical protein